MKRITLLTYSITMKKTNPATTRTAIRPPRIAGSIFGQPCCKKWRDDPVCRGKLVGKLKLPPEPVSPASRPTTASRIHCPNRKGCRSCRFVRWNATVIVSTAEIGKTHLGKASEERYCEVRGVAN